MRLTLLIALFPLATISAQRSRACWIVTPAEAAQILGRPELASGERMRDSLRDCDYLRAGFDVHMDHSRPVARQRESLEQNIKSNKAERVTGIGDAAGFEKSDKQPSLFVIKGPRALEVTLLMSKWNGTPEQIKPTLTKLAETALAKLAPSARASRACWLITPSEAAQILGRPQLKDGEQMHDDYDDCNYKGAGFDLDIIGYARAGPRRDGFKNLVARGNAEAVPEVGDWAILGRDADKHPTVNVLFGSHELMITWLEDPASSQTDIKPKLVQLAKTALARLQ